MSYKKENMIIFPELKGVCIIDRGDSKVDLVDGHYSYTFQDRSSEKLELAIEMIMINYPEITKAENATEAKAELISMLSEGDSKYVDYGRRIVNINGEYQFKDFYDNFIYKFETKNPQIFSNYIAHEIDSELRKAKSIHDEMETFMYYVPSWNEKEELLKILKETDARLQAQMEEFKENEGFRPTLADGSILVMIKEGYDKVQIPGFITAEGNFIETNSSVDFNKYKDFINEVNKTIVECSENGEKISESDVQTIIQLTEIECTQEMDYERE